MTGVRDGSRDIDTDASASCRRSYHRRRDRLCQLPNARCVAAGPRRVGVGQMMRVREIADGVGVDFAYEAVGIPKTIEQAVASLAYAGTATHIGLPEDEQQVTLNFGNVDTGIYWNKATLKVCHCGDALPSNDFPLLAQLYLQGQLKLDEMVTQRIGLGDVNEAFHAMHGGDILRSVIVL